MNTQTMTRGRTTIAHKAPDPNLPAVIAAGREREGQNQSANGKLALAHEVLSPPISYPAKIAKALLAITKAVGVIEKEGWNEFHKYHYQKWEDVLNTISPLLIEHGLLIQQSEVHSASTASDQLLSITYEFTIINSDGEVWPERMRWTAIARLKDGKGVYDDKCANKCHTQASKYFLLHLFKIRTESEDSDRGRRKGPNPNKRHEPCEIIANGPGAWAQAYLAAIGKAESVDEIREWGRLNEEKLSKLEQVRPELYANLAKQIEQRIAAFSPKPTTPKAPNPSQTHQQQGSQAEPQQEEQVLWEDPPDLVKEGLLKAIEQCNTEKDLLYITGDQDFMAAKGKLSDADQTEVDTAWLKRKQTVRNGRH